MRIGVVIRSLREQRGLGQAELAKRAGIQQSYLSRLETSSRQRVDARALALIARALEISVEEIYIAAGLSPSQDPQTDLRWKRMERVFRQLPRARQEDLLAIANTLSALPAQPLTLEPRIVGQVAEDQQQYEEGEKEHGHP